MSIAIQASDLDHPRIDGTRVYLKELLKRFGSIEPDQDFIIYHKGSFNPLLAPPEFKNYQVKAIPFSWAWMQTRFAFELFLKKPNILFLPIQAAPLFLPKKTKVVATIHDLAFKKYPETFTWKNRLKLSLMLWLAVKFSDKLIAVSQSTKNDLLAYFPSLSEQKVQVIYHGFDGAFFGTKVDGKIMDETLIKYSLRPKEYVLYVGALQPRKNLVRLIEAFEIAKQNYPEMKLVLAGESAWLAEDIHRAIDASDFRKDIFDIGAVTFEELRVLYQGARMFAFPSLYEGFGLPLLEAFASEVPVLTADNSSLREVAGDAALYCDAKNVENIREALEKLWENESLQIELREKGTERLRNFSWDTCAKKTLSYILR